MAALHELIQKIENSELRAQIQEAADRLTKQKKFGLVFEEHLPECTPLYDIPVRKGLKVSVRKGKANESYTVLKVADRKATCLPKNGTEALEFDVANLVTTAELGEPIYPCLQSLGEVCNAPDSKLWHTLIEADNYHALQLLEYLYAGKVDCIYIDPPYNKEDSHDWKYNCNYVDKNDEYRHSKWLSMIQKRLRIAKKLLNPIDSVLIVTIDEEEYLHLGCLLEEMFPEAKIQMISTIINPTGTKRADEFSRTNEFIFFVRVGQCSIEQVADVKTVASNAEVHWEPLRRHTASNIRDAQHPNQFFPIFIDVNTNDIVDIGENLPFGIDISTVEPRENCETVWPIRDNGIEMMWGLKRDTFIKRLNSGYVRIGRHTPNKPQKYSISYLASGTIEDIESGKAIIVGHDEHGAVKAYYKDGKKAIPTTQWANASHDAKVFGTLLLQQILLDRKFPFPKSLYAVKECLNLFIANKPEALIVDFFAGSGTTLHAVNLLNAEDNGRRRCIMVTNNEISEEERAEFETRNIQEGSEEWLNRGIARYITWPRTVCSIKGENINGEKLDDEYVTSNSITKTKKRSVTQISFIDPISTLSLQDKKKVIQIVSRGILPGKLVTAESDFVVSEDSKHTVSVLLDEAKSAEWIASLSDMEHIDELFVLTKDKKTFNSIKKQIDENLSPIEYVVPVTFSMSDGFKSNAVFFKLGFLDKTKVSLRMQFKELLSTLWMKAGAIGKCPTIDGAVPDMLILPENKMAVLTDENRFCEFAEQLAQHPEIDVVYLVTDYESSFVAMTQVLEGKQTYQLYRDYLDNFRINAGRNSR